MQAAAQAPEKSTLLSAMWAHSTSHRGELHHNQCLLQLLPSVPRCRAPHVLVHSCCCDMADPGRQGGKAAEREISA